MSDEARALIQKWREEADTLDDDKNPIRYGRAEQLRDCADELESLLFNASIASESRYSR